MRKYPPCVSAGAESVSANIGLSFRVTGEDLATGGVLIELCDDGNSTKNPVATGEATLQLLRCSGSTVEAHPADGPSIGAAANSTNSGIDTEVRHLTVGIHSVSVYYPSQRWPFCVCPPGTHLGLVFCGCHS